MGDSLVRVGSLIAKELIQFRRDRLLAAFILLAPALQLILLARAIERGITEQPVVILDYDRSRLSRELITDLDNADQLRVMFHTDSVDQMRVLIDQGKARMGVIIPAGFASKLGRAGAGGSFSQAGDPDLPQRIQVIADATNSVAASYMLGTASGVVSRFAADLVAGHGLTTPEYIDVRTDIRFNPSMDIRDYSIPAQLGFIVYQVTLAVAALGLARERELGTLEQLAVTPLRRLELTLGKGIPAMAVGGLNFAGMWVIGRALFHVPMNGSRLLLAALTLLFIFTVVSWGLVLSAVARTQQQAILFVFVQAMTDITFSGFLAPVRNLPLVLRTIARFVPLQHYLVIIRGIMLKGAGLNELWPQVVALAALSLVMGLLALRTVARWIE